MIITCPSCKKKFNININLIPSEGRNLQCGSCEHIWFYKKKNQDLESPLINEPINDNISIKENEDSENINVSKTNDKLIDQLSKENNKEETKSSDVIEAESKPEVITKTQSNNFFSYLIVFIISLVALFILIDTLKTPLINVFPGLELFLFNLYETLKDIKLFIIDLS